MSISTLYLEGVFAKVSCNIISRIIGCKDFGFQYNFNDVLFVQQLIISFFDLKVKLKYLKSKNIPFFMNMFIAN
jgi:phage terminase large subunit